MNGDWSEISDEALGRRLAAELPRYQAQPGVRAAIVQAIEPRRERSLWMASTLSALSAALAFVLLYLVMPGQPRAGSGEAVDRLVNAVVAEHTRALMWGARRPIIVAALTEEAGIGLTKAFDGDDSLSFEGAEPVYLDWRRGVALHYRDQDGHHLTYVVLPAPRMPVPDRLRVQVDRFKPALMRVGGFSTWMWKQGDLACFLVSDMVSETDIDRFKDYFVRVRTATEPYLAY